MQPTDISRDDRLRDLVQMTVRKLPSLPEWAFRKFNQSYDHALLSSAGLAPRTLFACTFYLFRDVSFSVVQILLFGMPHRRKTKYILYEK